VRFTPLLADATRPCRHAVGNRWQVDETYVKVAGQWRYVYRAIDQFGQVVDVFVSVRRDATAARRFFERGAIGAMKTPPTEVVTDRRRAGGEAAGQAHWWAWRSRCITSSSTPMTYRPSPGSGRRCWVGGSSPNESGRS